MKHKKLKLLALPLAVASASVIGMVSGTLAYFTSQDKATVSIEAGQVKVSLLASDLKVYSLGVEQTDTGTVGEKTVTYFENHGYAYMEGNTITLDRITPGDKVTFDVKFKNESNVDIKYAIYPEYVDEETGVGRTDAGKVVPHAGDTVTGSKKLSTGLSFNIENESSVPYDGTLLNLSAGSPDVVHHLSLELPADAGNEYQGAKARIVLTAYAEQKNGPTERVAFNWLSLKSQAAQGDATVYVLNSIDKPVSESLHVTGDLILDGSLASTKPVIKFDSPGGNVHSVIIQDGSLTINNIRIEDDTKDHYSTFSIQTNDVDLTLKNSEFISKYAVDTQGSCIFARKTSNVSNVGKITIDNCVIDGYGYAFYGYYCNNVDEFNINNSIIDVATYTINVDSGPCKINVSNSTLAGWTSYGTNIVGKATFTNVNFKKSSYSDYDLLRAYSDTQLTNCKFYDSFGVEIVDGASVWVDGCKFVDSSLSTETAVTTSNFSEHITLVPSTYGLDTGLEAYIGTTKVSERFDSALYHYGNWPSLVTVNGWFGFTTDSIVMPLVPSGATEGSEDADLKTNLVRNGDSVFGTLRVTYNKNLLSETTAQAWFQQYYDALSTAGFTYDESTKIWTSANGEIKLEIGVDLDKWRLTIYVF